jgi:predicted DNA-binding WGR domain protein
MAQVKRYFELNEGSSTRFWEVWLDGVEVRTRHGRIGSGGQAQVEGLGSPQEAEEHSQKLILQKTIEGYAEVDRSGVDDEDDDDVPTERVAGGSEEDETKG